MRRTRPTPTAPAALAGVVVVVLGAALALAGCGDDGGDGDGRGAATTTTVAATGTTSTTGPGEEGLHEEGLGALEEIVQSLLIQPGELGDPSYADIGYSPGRIGAGCGGEGGAGPPADVLAGTAVASEPLATSVVEEVRVYESGAAAAEAFALASVAAGCGPATEVGAEVGADRAVAFDGAPPGPGGTYVVALVADTVLVFHVLGGALDPIEVAAFGAGKVLAALEG